METQTEPTLIEKQKGTRWGLWLIVLAIILVLYCLSFGPAMRLKAQGAFSHHRRTSQALAYFYWPIIWSHNHTPLRKPIEGYVSLWLPTSNKEK